MYKETAILFVVSFLVASSILVAPSFSYSSADEDSWTTLAPMPTARYHAGVAVVDDKIFVIGGRNDWINRYLGTNEMYDPVLDTWSTKTSMPTPRIDFSIAVYEGKIYVFGGIVGTNGDSTIICATTEVYDPATDSWETKAAIPTPRLGASASVVNNKIYVIGGYQRYDKWPYQGGSLKNEVYDPETDTWTARALIEYDFVRATSVVDGNRIYVIGGQTGTIAPSGWSNLNRIYDTTGDTWTTAAPIPVGVESAAGAIANGGFDSKRIYILGGFIADCTPCNLTQIYNPEKDVWVTGAEMPTPHASFGVANVNDELFAIGGVLADLKPPSNATEKYVPTKITEDILVLSPQPKTYEDTILQLTFAINRSTSWMGYSLDGQETLAVTENTTLSGLSNGSHNVTVYAKDEFGKLATSETIIFTLNKPEQFSMVLIVAVSLVVATVVPLGILVCIRKRKR